MLIAIMKELIAVGHNRCLLYILFWQHDSTQCGQCSVYYWHEDDHIGSKRVATINL